MASKKTSKDYRTRTALTRKAGRGESPARAQPSDITIWERELAYFKRVKADLLQNARYINKYIAIKQNQIIDSDTDEFKLVRRINKAYPDEVVFIAKVDEKENIGVVRSPRVAK